MNVLVRLTDPMVIGWFKDHPEISAPRFIGESLKQKYGVDTAKLKPRRKNRLSDALFVSITDGNVVRFLKSKKQDGFIIRCIVEKAVKEAIANGSK